MYPIITTTLIFLKLLLLLDLHIVTCLNIPLVFRVLFDQNINQFEQSLNQGDDKKQRNNYYPEVKITFQDGVN
jgi:hypothetical protein